MFARMTLLLMACAFSGGVFARPALAADFGISFHYGSSSSGCYSTWLAPGYYAYYADCWDYDEPLVYVSYAIPRVVTYQTCYPVTYRTSYSRTYSYVRPVRHSRVTVRYASGDCGSHSRYRVTRQRYYTRPRSASRGRYVHGSLRYRHESARSRPSSRAYDRHSRSHYRSSDSPHRYRGSGERNTRWHRRLDHLRRRLRFNRR